MEGEMEVKVLVFNWRDTKNPLGGGAEENIHQMGLRWVKMGHKVTLFCSAFEGCELEENVDGIDVVRAGGRFTVYIHALFKYISRFRKEGYDVTIDDVNGIPFLCKLYSRSPTIVLFHHRVGDIFFRELPYPAALFGFLVESKLFPLVYKRSKVVAVSDSTKEDMVEMGFPARNISVITNGVEPGLYVDAKTAKTKYPSVLYLGRVKKYKQLDRLVKAFPKWKKKVPGVKLIIAGDGDDLERLRSMVDQKGLSKDVWVLGRVSDKKKKFLLRSSWVFATPSHREGWGITTIEANACQTPVVAYDVEGLRDSVKRGYSGYLAKNSKEFDRYIIKVLRDPKLRKRFGQDTKEWAERFSWDGSAQKFVRLMKKVSN